MASATKHILVVGLGNYTHPGTRHSVGMMVVDSIAQRFNVPWTKKGPWQAEVATATTTITMRKRKPPPRHSPAAITAADTALPASVPRKKEQFESINLEITLTLLKPLQLMNVSGTSVSRAAKDLGIPVSDILVIHDDMERDIGKLSFKSEGSANGHNGIKSCIKSLGTQHFKRLRVGIGRPPIPDRSPKVVAGFVLGRFKPLEIEQLEHLVYEKAGNEIIRVTAYPSTPMKRS
ncbi:peptidyl-tRNA hydrolase protein 1 [Haplosporangium sp. Z 767]|nr:peptidyl-tRNA hydrolase protein 1 [Haplosporangium sp. Z 767]KAF9195722.1 peptidyl-tRNA hydrolase protein 1 [Haplosporangium sp. Z 11]